MIKTKLLFFLLSFSAWGFAQTDDSGPLQTQPVRNIILMIGDGMGTTQVSAGITASQGKLTLTEFKDIGFSKTQSASDYITDSGAGGTAIAFVPVWLCEAILPVAFAVIALRYSLYACKNLLTSVAVEEDEP